MSEDCFSLTYLNSRGFAIVGWMAVFLGGFSVAPFIPTAPAAIPTLRPAKWLVINLLNIDWNLLILITAIESVHISAKISLLCTDFGHRWQLKPSRMGNAAGVLGREIPIPPLYTSRGDSVFCGRSDLQEMVQL